MPSSGINKGDAAMADSRFFAAGFNYSGPISHHPRPGLAKRVGHYFSERMHRQRTVACRHLDDLDQHLLDDVGIERRGKVVGWVPSAHGGDPTSITENSYRSSDRNPH
jgi:uncharacterized protein YjiS (DUF1127 family)